MKKFAFLIQARAESDYFKKFQSEDADCYLLFFKTKINQERAFYRPNTTWTEGRNILLKESYGKQNYEYYVFLDDDARIVNKNDGSCGIENFKKYLLKYKPAIGITDYPSHLSYETIMQRKYFPFLNDRPRLKKIAKKIFRENHVTSGISYFDACVNAFHRKSIKLLLPYEDKFDAISWWWSQEILTHVTRQVCPENILMFDKLETLNLKNDAYPQDSDLLELNKCFTEYLYYALKNKSVEHKLYPHSRQELYSTKFKNVDKSNFDYQSKVNKIFDSNHEYTKKKNEFWKQLAVSSNIDEMHVIQ